MDDAAFLELFDAMLGSAPAIVLNRFLDQLWFTRNLLRITADVHHALDGAANQIAQIDDFRVPSAFKSAFFQALVLRQIGTDNEDLDSIEHSGVELVRELDRVTAELRGEWASGRNPERLVELYLDLVTARERAESAWNYAISMQEDMTGLLQRMTSPLPEARWCLAEVAASSRDLCVVLPEEIRARVDHHFMVSYNGRPSRFPTMLMANAFNGGIAAMEVGQQIASIASIRLDRSTVDRMAVWYLVQLVVFAASELDLDLEQLQQAVLTEDGLTADEVERFGRAFHTFNRVAQMDSPTEAPYTDADMENMFSGIWTMKTGGADACTTLLGLLDELDGARADHFETSRELDDCRTMLAEIIMQEPRIGEHFARRIRESWEDRVAGTVREGGLTDSEIAAIASTDSLSVIQDSVPGDTVASNQGLSLPTLDRPPELVLLDRQDCFDSPDPDRPSRADELQSALVSAEGPYAMAATEAAHRQAGALAALEAWLNSKPAIREHLEIAGRAMHYPGAQLLVRALHRNAPPLEAQAIAEDAHADLDHWLAASADRVGVQLSDYAPVGSPDWTIRQGFRRATVRAFSNPHLWAAEIRLANEVAASASAVNTTTGSLLRERLKALDRAVSNDEDLRAAFVAFVQEPHTPEAFATEVQPLLLEIMRVGDPRGDERTGRDILEATRERLRERGWLPPEEGEAVGVDGPDRPDMDPQRAGTPEDAGEVAANGANGRSTNSSSSGSEERPDDPHDRVGHVARRRYRVLARVAPGQGEPAVAGQPETGPLQPASEFTTPSRAAAASGGQELNGSGPAEVSPPATATHEDRGDGPETLGRQLQLPQN